MRIKILIWTMGSVILLSHCKKNPPTPPLPTYTIKGKFINGTTGEVLYLGQTAQLEVRTLPLYGNVQSAILGNCTIDTGGFKFTYTQTNINYWGAYLRVDLPLLNSFGSFPVNQNVNKNIYLSTLGTLKIYLKTQNSLIKGDTFFFSYYPDLNSAYNFDTITQPINGYYKTFRVPATSLSFFWGRGAKNFVFDSTGTIKGFTKVGGGPQEVSIHGDPIVDSTTINY